MSYNVIVFNTYSIYVATAGPTGLGICACMHAYMDERNILNTQNTLALQITLY